MLTETIGFHPKKLWYTFRGLMIRPGQVIIDYCSGDRKESMTPVSYFLVAYGFSYMVAEVTGFFTWANGRGNYYQLAELFKDSFSSNPRLNVAFLKALPIVFSQQVFWFVYVPSIVLSWWLLFRMKKKPFIHHLYFVLFVSAQINIVTWAPKLYRLFSHSGQWMVDWFSLIFSTAFFVVAAKSFYEINYGEALLRYLVAAHVLIYVPLALLLSATHAVIVFYLYFFIQG